MSEPELRVRFAPSPTGHLHVGGARTMLFNWLLARQSGGRMVLRIEDTDRTRSTDEALRLILDGLHWLGLDWDEGPDVGGPFGPYRQSERGDIYERQFRRLADAGCLYEEGGATRFRAPHRVDAVDDIICGRVSFEGRNEPDPVIRRADGTWIFHFVNVVDDLDMRITHVLRGEDHLSNTPKHLELFAALGAPPPRYGHIPLILNRDGSKMSKRDAGASLATYIERGYAPEAVANYLSLLGWSPKDDREIFSRAELVERFQLAGINRKNAAFNLEKCEWMNQQHFARMSPERFAELARPFLERAGFGSGDDAYAAAVLRLVQPKTRHLADLPAYVSYLFDDNYAFEPDAAAILEAEGALGRLAALGETLSNVEPWDAGALEVALKALATRLGCKAGALVHPARAAASGRTIGPSLYHMLEVLGRTRTLTRLKRARRFGVAG